MVTVSGAGIKRIVFWQNILSPHQAACIAALAEFDDFDVYTVSHVAMSGDRADQGWSIPDFGRARVICSPSDDEILDICSESPEKSLHFVSLNNDGNFRTGYKAFQICRNLPVKLGIISESGDKGSMPGPRLFLLRWLKGVWRRFRYGRFLNLILAMGDRGVRWFNMCGYDRKTVFPFLYTIDSKGVERKRRVNSRLSLLYVGRCCDAKGGGDLLEALAVCQDLEWRADFVGDGPDRQQWITLAEQLGVADRVNFQGRLSSDRVMPLYGSADLLVLPSRFEGWGAVVNEALCLGVPVICGSECGAASLIREKWRGSVFKSGDADSLAMALREHIIRGPIGLDESQRIQEWAIAHISGKSAAKYLRQVIGCLSGEAVKPLAPWEVE